MDEIIERHEEDIPRVVSGEVGFEDVIGLYSDLHRHFLQQMPYDIAMSETGDDKKWIMEQLRDAALNQTNS